ncbi:hypothetical protein KKG31_05080 [Patescibacteria group bacterium]|nr:hypothetical protein [Patescibacteria group bacterium]MBU1758497.1 hypothetical protein [Patescibacteria group bacterium]
MKTIKILQKIWYWIFLLVSVSVLSFCSNSDDWSTISLSEDDIDLSLNVDGILDSGIFIIQIMDDSCHNYAKDITNSAIDPGAYYYWVHGLLIRKEFNWKNAETEDDFFRLHKSYQRNTYLEQWKYPGIPIWCSVLVFDVKVDPSEIVIIK